MYSSMELGNSLCLRQESSQETGHKCCVTEVTEEKKDRQDDEKCVED